MGGGSAHLFVHANEKRKQIPLVSSCPISLSPIPSPSLSPFEVLVECNLLDGKTLKGSWKEQWHVPFHGYQEGQDDFSTLTPNHIMILQR